MAKTLVDEFNVRKRKSSTQLNSTQHLNLAKKNISSKQGSVIIQHWTSRGTPGWNFRARNRARKWERQSTTNCEHDSHHASKYFVESECNNNSKCLGDNNSKSAGTAAFEKGEDIIGVPFWLAKPYKIFYRIRSLWLRNWFGSWDNEMHSLQP